MAKITVLAPVFWQLTGTAYRYYGGVEPLIEGIMSEWVKQGHEVSCVCAHGSKSWDGVKVHTASQPLTPQIHTAKFEQALFQRYEQEILKSDVIWDNTHFMPSFVEKHLKKWDVPIYATWHHSPDNLQTMPPVDYEHFIAISKWQQQALSNKFGVPFHHVYNPVRQDVYKNTELDGKGKHWLFLGRISTVKGVAMVPQLARDFPDERFVITGDTLFTNESLLAQNLLRQADELPNLKIHYNCNFDEKCEYLRTAKGLLHTSLWQEPYGLILLEAFVYGKPVLAFARGASPEIIAHKKNGYLVEGRGASLEEEYALYKAGFMKFAGMSWNSKNIRKIDKRFHNDFAAKEYLRCFGI